MSEAKSSKKKASKAKSETAPTPKAESKSESASPAPKAAESTDSADSTPAASSDTKSSESGKEAGKDGGKSARESAGGKSDAHYGYFSSVRTPEYRGGWDAIWGSKNGDGADEDETPRQRRAAGRASRPAKARKRRDPVTVTLDLDDLPPALKEELVEIASARLKESRVSYARRDKAGAIDWRITCRAD